MQIASHLVTQPEPLLYEINAADIDRMKALLDAAENRQEIEQKEVTSTRITRSKGVQLEWNPEMNNDSIVIAKDDETH